MKKLFILAVAISVGTIGFSQKGKNKSSVPETTKEEARRVILAKSRREKSLPTKRKGKTTVNMIILLRMAKKEAAPSLPKTSQPRHDRLLRPTIPVLPMLAGVNIAATGPQRSATMALLLRLFTMPTGNARTPAPRLTASSYRLR